MYSNQIFCGGSYLATSLRINLYRKWVDSAPLGWLLLVTELRNAREPTILHCLDTLLLIVFFTWHSEFTDIINKYSVKIEPNFLDHTLKSLLLCPIAAHRTSPDVYGLIFLIYHFHIENYSWKTIKQVYFLQNQETRL